VKKGDVGHVPSPEIGQSLYRIAGLGEGHSGQAVQTAREGLVEGGTGDPAGEARQVGAGVPVVIRGVKDEHGSKARRVKEFLGDVGGEKAEGGWRIANCEWRITD